MEDVTILATLTGAVRGVGLRKSVVDVALKGDVAGWVTNAKARSVQVVVRGSFSECMSFLGAIRELPEPVALAGMEISLIQNVDVGRTFQILGNVEHSQRMAAGMKRKNPRRRRISAIEAVISNQNLALSQAYRESRGDNSRGAQALRRDATNVLLARNDAGDSVIRKNKDLSGIESFRRMLYLQTRADQLRRDPIYYAMLNKRKSYKFVHSVGIDHPAFTKTFGYDEARATIEAELQRHPHGIVVKPVNSFASTGIYIVRQSGRISAIGRQAPVDDIDHLLYLMKDDIRPEGEAKWNDGRINKPEWYIEECISDDAVEAYPARDLKFYCFYGEVEMVMEVDRYPKKKYTWWTIDREYVEPGLYHDYYGPGRGFEDRHVEVAKKLSLELPLPFMRIDFLASGDRLAFNEFGGRPGIYSRFHRPFDQKMGRAYLEAAERLKWDLLRGKKFSHLPALIGEI